MEMDQYDNVGQQAERTPGPIDTGGEHKRSALNHETIFGLSKESAVQSIDSFSNLFRREIKDISHFGSGYMLFELQEQVGLIKDRYSGDVEVQYAAKQFELVINEYKRLRAIQQEHGEEFQVRFDGLVRSFLETIRKSFRETAEYFEKLAILAVALLGAYISAVIAVVAHLQSERAIIGIRLLAITFLVYISAIGLSLFGQFGALVQSGLALERLIETGGGTQLKRSAEVFVTPQTKMKEEQARIDAETKAETEKRENTIVNRVAGLITHKQSFWTASCCIVAIIVALVLSAYFLLLNIVPNVGEQIPGVLR